MHDSRAKLTSLLLVTLASLNCCQPSARAADEPGFVSIFDGRSLAGWLGQDMSFWSVADGAITGTITPEHAPAMNQYLVWQGGLVEDFELKLDFRLTGATSNITNGGFQFRSRRLPNGDVAGYQVDNNFAQPWKVRLYDEFGRHDLAVEGQRTVFDELGKRHVEMLELAPGAADFQLERWHEYHLTAIGPKLSLAINGRLVAETTDNDPEQFEPLGVLAMQLHTGPPQQAQFRNLRLKQIAPAKPVSPRERLLATAALDWHLGERPASHQPPLEAHGKFATYTYGEGEGARRGVKVARLDQGYFDGGSAWNVPGQEITVYVRARAPDGNWNGGLFSKRGTLETVNFNLFAADLPSTPGPDVGFEIHTGRTLYRLAFPLSQVDPRAWHDLVGRYNGSVLEILCDGRVMARRDARGELTQNDAPILIGAESDHGRVARPFVGELEEASLWTRFITDDEVSTLVREH